jgi:hypothetical protein
VIFSRRDENISSAEKRDTFQSHESRIFPDDQAVVSCVLALGIKLLKGILI